METWSKYETGLYTPSETSLLIRRRHDLIPASKRKAIILLHGHSAGPQQWAVGTPNGDHAQALAHAGYWVFSVNAAGGATWNNDTAMTAITAAYNWLMAQGMGSTKVGIMAWSMGGGNGFVWMKNNPTLVSGLCAWAPNTNLDYYHSDGSYASEIDTAYGGNYAVNSVGHKIADEYTTWRNLAPILLIHGDADTTAPLSHSQALVAGINQTQVNLITVSNGTHYSFASIPISNTVTFFDAGYW